MRVLCVWCVTKEGVGIFGAVEGCMRARDVNGISIARRCAQCVPVIGIDMTEFITFLVVCRLFDLAQRLDGGIKLKTLYT